MQKKTVAFLAALPVLALLSGCSSTEVTNDVLVVGMEVNYAPFNWAESEENEYTLPVQNAAGVYADGYDVQIAKRLGEILDRDVQIVRTAWESLIPDLQYGTINLVIAGMTDTEERRLSVDFSDEYYRSELVLVTQSQYSDPYEGTTLDEETFASFVSNQIIVSQSNTVTDDVIDTFVSEYGAIHANPVDSFALAATDVSNGSAFAMTAELPVANSIVSSFDNLGIVHMDQEILGEARSELGVSIAIQQGNDELLEDVNYALSLIDEDERTELMEAAVIRSASAS